MPLDPVLDGFLRGVAWEAGFGEPAETPTEPLARPTPVSAARHQMDERRAADRRRLFRILSAVAVVVGLIVAFVVWEKLGETSIVVDWPLDERHGATITVDSVDRPVGQQKSLRFAGGVGKRTVVLKRPGYQLIERSWKFDRGQSQAFRPQWKPTGDTIRLLEFATLERDVAAYIATLKESGLPSDFSKSLSIQRRIHAHLDRYELTAERVAACADLINRLPAPVDALRREDIDAYELKSAGQGDPAKAPTKLVAVFGDSHLRHWSQVNDIAFSPTEDLIASVGLDETVRLWDPTSGEQIAAFSTDAQAFSVAFSPNGNLLAIGEVGASVQIEDLQDRNSGAAKRRLVSDAEGILRSITFSADGKLIAGCTNGGFVLAWNLEENGRLAFKATHGVSVGAVVFHPASHALVSASDDGTVKQWDLTSGKSTWTSSDYGVRVTSLAFDADGKRLAMANDKGECRVIDMADHSELWMARARSASGETGRMHDVVFSPDEKQLATAFDRGVAILEAKNGTQLRALPGLYVATHVCFDRTGKRLAACTASIGGIRGFSGIRQWDTSTWNLKSSLSPSYTQMDLAPDGGSLALGTTDGKIDILEMATQKVVHRFDSELPYPTSAMRFSSDGRRLVTVNGVYGSPQTLRVWNTIEGRLDRILREGRQPRVIAMAYDRSGQRLALSRARTGGLESTDW